jgi:molybdate transport system permease protein
MASMWRKAMLYLGLGPDDEYDDFDVTGEHQQPAAPTGGSRSSRRTRSTALRWTRVRTHVLAFARSLGDFGATLMVAGNIPGKTQTAAIAIYDATQAGRDAEALTLVLILSLTAFALLYATNRLAGANVK